MLDLTDITFLPILDHRARGWSPLRNVLWEASLGDRFSSRRHGPLDVALDVAEEVGRLFDQAGGPLLGHGGAGHGSS